MEERASCKGGFLYFKKDGKKDDHMKTLYIIKSSNFSQVCQEGQLEEQVKDLIESEFKHTKYHYSGDEFIAYHSEFFSLIAPYYI
uniref:hypothetical protein n=1 Tax=Staphylococcus simulans TaxID=1286 RepID=UPI00155DDA09|nr:hypothetical protein [Staphylococcus simulans]